MTDFNVQETAAVKKTRTAIEKATAKLDQASEALAKQVVDMSVTITELADSIESRSEELAALDNQVELKRAEAKNNLQVAILQDKEETLRKELDTMGYAFVSEDTLKGIEQAADKAKEELLSYQRVDEDTVSDAVHSAVSKAVESLTSEHKVALAEKNSQITYLEKEVESLSDTIASLRQDITDERNARVAISANQQFTINTATQK